MSPTLLILKNYTTFKDVQKVLKHFFDISTGFRYKKKWKRVLRPSIEMSMGSTIGGLACVWNFESEEALYLVSLFDLRYGITTKMKCVPFSPLPWQSFVITTIPLLPCLVTSDESEPSWLEPELELKDFQLGSAWLATFFTSARN